jgi:hypothetical protein
MTDYLDEEELVNWNYAKDLDRQMKGLKADNREDLKELKKPYEQIKTDLAAFDLRGDMGEAR